ncbi:hypothetical protein V6N11_050110 [Hibiscus sabdariffa]|uniref:Uncharacterized protein n=1 Tax=Hibiscus sabdariffa TaxID=183260 RepID=A0ABR2T8V8_9ROSI
MKYDLGNVSAEETRCKGRDNLGQPSVKYRTPVKIQQACKLLFPRGSGTISDMLESTVHPLAVSPLENLHFAFNEICIRY